MNNTHITSEFLRREFAENQDKVEADLIELLTKELEGNLDSVSENNLATFRRVFDFDAEYSFCSWWKASIPYDIESSETTNDPEKAKEFFDGDGFEQPDEDAWEVTSKIEFEGSPAYQELEDIEIVSIVPFGSGGE